MNAKIVLVSEDDRLGFLPELYGPSLSQTGRGESATYAFARKFSNETYYGGYWEFARIVDLEEEFNEKPLFMYPAPPSNQPDIITAINPIGFSMDFSYRAFGVVCTLFALEYLYMSKGTTAIDAARYIALNQALKDCLSIKDLFDRQDVKNIYSFID